MKVVSLDKILCSVSDNAPEYTNGYSQNAENTITQGSSIIKVVIRGDFVNWIIF